MKGLNNHKVQMKQHLIKACSTSHNQSKAEHQCCAKIKEALIDLYIEVKVRNETSIQAVTPETLQIEKEKLRYLDSLDLIEYLRSSIEILLSLNLCGGIAD